MFPGQVAGQVRLADDRFRADGGEVVAVEGDVDGASGNLDAFVLLDEFSQPLGQLDAAALDADEHQVLGAVVQLEHFDRHSLERPRQGAGVHHHAAVGPSHPGPENYLAIHRGQRGPACHQGTCSTPARWSVSSTRTGHARGAP